MELAYKSTGPAVAELQTHLNTLGFNCGAVDGKFGGMTLGALKRYQQARGLVPDGIAGTNTQASIVRDLNSASNSPATTIHTRDIQLALANKGFNPGPIDGDYGPRTTAAVKAFQKSKGLVQDGIAGPITCKALFGQNGGQNAQPAPTQSKIGPYEILQRPISQNRSHIPFIPQGMTWHDTEDEGATDENEVAYFNSGYRAASAHYFADWDSISQDIPDNEEAWHAGPTANSRYLSLELCHTNDPIQFREVYNRAIWLTAVKCKQYGWDPANINQVNNHAWVSNTFHETNHQDPIAYLAQHGISWAQVVADIKANML